MKSTERIQKAAQAKKEVEYLTYETFFHSQRNMQSFEFQHRGNLYKLIVCLLMSWIVMSGGIAYSSRVLG